MAIKTANIRKHNPAEFLKDMKACACVLVHAQSTGDYFKAYKRDIYMVAETTKIIYHTTNKLYVSGKLAMIIH